jgi:plastocyanin
MERSRRRRLTGSLIGVAMVASIVAAVLPAPPANAAVTITATTAAHWSPASVTIAHGTTIRWHAQAGLSHTVKSYGGNWSFSRSLPSGTTVSHTFSTRGTFRFYCTIHGRLVHGVCQGMCGVIKVT